jgi:hypothetical protein
LIVDQHVARQNPAPAVFTALDQAALKQQEI